MLSVFPIRALNILFEILYDNFNMSVVSESGSDDCFAFSDNAFTCLLVCLTVICERLGILYVVRTVAIMWIEIALCLIFALARGANGLEFFQCPYFYLPSFLGLS